MLSRDPMALAGTGAPAVLVANSLPVPVMMSLWRSWTEILFRLHCCNGLPCFITCFLVLLRAALVSLICIASLHFETHIKSHCIELYFLRIKKKVILFCGRCISRLRTTIEIVITPFETRLQYQPIYVDIVFTVLAL